jgi:pimeloyl-ACP methyl ester carboxylesterase
LVVCALTEEVVMTGTNALNVVLVHGGFVDGAGWEGVYRILRKDGYNVGIVQNSTASLADDVKATKLVLDALDGPVILVGHSYGGVVITEAGNDPKVAGLVYIAAFAPDKGESVEALIKNLPPGAPVPPILPPRNGYLFLDKAKFRASFAADVDEEKAAFMADSQVPWGVEALAAQRAMSKRAGSTVVEEKGSHAIYVSKPGSVAALIQTAVKGVHVAAN